MATLVYLDVDDEITSAAARMRDASEGRVGLVVPYGSRLATSRINFRLLAREAQVHGRQLSIVAADGATRALAASAGLPVFASVGEYETALAEPAAGEDAGDRDGDDGDDGDGERAATRRTTQTGAVGAGGAAAGVASLPDAGGTSDARLEAAPPQRNRKAADLAETTVVATPLATRDVAAAQPPAGRDAPGPGLSSIPVARGRRERIGRTPVLVGAGLVALLLLVAGVAAYVFLPSATIAVTPRLQPVGPVVVEVRADPAATAVDQAGRTIPAERLTFPLQASDTFPATDKRVESTKATGRVTFRSKDPTTENRIAAGSIVATQGGVRFRTLAAVTIPKAAIVGLQIVPGQVSVRIEAVKDGPEGNVDANTITVIPRGEDPMFTDVRNPDPTEGGSRREFPRVGQADVDRAIEELTKQLGQQFAERLADPASVPDGTTLFPETQTLGDPVPSVDPASLVGQEVPRFELALSAEGAVTAVDERPLETLAAGQVQTAVDAGHRLVGDSIAVEVGDPTVDGEVVVFPVTVRATQAPVLDPAQLIGRVKGRPLAEARSILEPYGRVEISTWPEWVTAIPTIDGRVTLEIVDASSPATSPSGSPAASQGTGRASPSGAP